MRSSASARREGLAYLEPLGALLAKAKALKAKTDACLASALWVRPLVTFL